MTLTCDECGVIFYTDDPDDPSTTCPACRAWDDCGECECGNYLEILHALAKEEDAARTAGVHQ